MSETPTTDQRDSDEGTGQVEDAEIVETRADDAPADPAETRAAEDAAEDPRTTHHGEDDHDDLHTEGQSGVAATALKILILVIVIFGLSLWLVPLLAPHLPAEIAKRVMPGREMIDTRLSAIDDRVATQTEAATAKVAAMEETVATLTARLEAAEAEAAAARTAADEARAEAARSAEIAGTATVADDLVESAELAARQAAETAETATTAATEAGKVASAATRDAAALSRRMTSFEARLTSIADELRAIEKGFATAAQTSEASGSQAASPELAAAVSALQARVDGLGPQIEGAVQGLVTEEDAARFATQDDLRSARTALEAELSTRFAAIPDPKVLITVTDLDRVQTDLGSKVETLTERVDVAEAAATAAKAGAEDAMSRVGTAIRDASVRSAVAALMSRMQNGAAFADSLEELASLTDIETPEALSRGAERGLATSGSLLRGFGRMAQAAQAADLRANSDDGLFGQTTARLRSVVAGRPKDEQPGDDVASILSRIEARLRDGALGEAMAEVERLPEPSREAIAEWAGRLKDRVDADEAARAYVAALRSSEG